MLRRKWHEGMWIRLGRIPASLIESLSGKKNIWIHAVSVGEVTTIVDLAKKLKQEKPTHSIVCSVVTKTGYQVACERLKGLAVVIFAPLDFSFIVRKYLRLINPSIYISAETELWPNMFYWLHKRNIPIVIINGRISDKSLGVISGFLFLQNPFYPG